MRRDFFVTGSAADTLRLADHMFIDELRKAGWNDKTSEAFAVSLPVKSVGVAGDGVRTALKLACGPWRPSALS